MVAEEVVVSLSGGAPWGFRLQGGAEHHKPLQVAKVRKRSKACRAGLKEDDELVAIGDHVCAELSHAQAMSLIDTQRATLSLKVKRAPSGFTSSSHSVPSVTVLSPPEVPLPSHRPSVLSPTGAPTGVTSPPNSEAYYGETDSDVDTQTHAHRRQRRTPPHARSPGRYDNQEEEETSEMSGYESAPDGGVSLQGHWEEPELGERLPGVPRRELVYQPPQMEWDTPAHTPHTLTPHTLTPTPDQGLVEGEGEGDSGFQEAGGCVGLACSPLVSPERAKEAMMLGSARQLVPMVGPQLTPISDELSTTYKDKARQAKLQRGESVVEKQVKEARTKCRSIASLLTDAPNPNSKGVLMFKKRRQRAKKYTLTCFGKAEGDGGETEGDTGGETEEEGGSSFLSGSDVDEEGFSASFDPTWDSGYLDLLDRKSSACPSSTPTTPTTNHNPGLDISTYQSPGLEVSGFGSAYQDSRLESGGTNQPIMSPPAVALTNGGSVAVSRANVVLSPPSQAPLLNQNGHHGNPNPTPNPNFNPNPNIDSDHNLNINLSANPGSVLNRTARPFTPGPPTARVSVTPVAFRPPQPKPAAVTTVTKPVVTMVTIPPPRQPSGPDARRAVSSTSLYIAPRNSNNSSVHSPPSALSPASSLASAPTNLPPFSPQYSVHAAPFSPPSTPFSPSTAPPFSPAAPLLYPSPAQAFPPAVPQFPSPPGPNCPPTPGISAPPFSPPPPPGPAQVYIQAQLSPPPPHPPAHAQPPPPLSFNPYNMPPQASDSLATREQRISVPAARTGILAEARRRSQNKKPMFCSVQNKDISPNPALLSMLQNMNDHTASGLSSAGPRGCGAGAGGEAGHESGPEEDSLRLGAEACNFMQAQRGPRPPPVAPKPQAPQVPQLGGKGGQLFARRQSRMDRYMEERAPSAAAAPYSPAHTREPSPTPSLPAAWKYSSNIRAPPPISYNPLLSPSCPLKAQKPQKAAEVTKAGGSKAGGKKERMKPEDIMSHQPYQLNSSLFSYGGGTPQNTSQMPVKTARVCEVRRFSTPPPTGPALKVIVPRSATTLGEPLWRSDVTSPPPYQSQPQWAPSLLSPPPPPAPTAPLPQLPTLASNPFAVPTFTHLPPSSTAQANRQFKSAPDLSPLGPAGAVSSCTQPARGPRPRFSTSNLGLQPSVWRPGSNMH